MKRRKMLQLSSIYAVGVPLLPSMGLSFSYQAQWQGWLQTLIKNCQIEQAHVFFHPVTLPKEERAGFISATNKYYFYQQQQYCFTIFEKYHPATGLLELALPFWGLQTNGIWEKLTCLSLFQLEVLANTSVALAKTANIKIEDYLLPKMISKAGEPTYYTAKGTVNMLSRVQSAGVQTVIQVKNQEAVVWQGDFLSTHCLTCQ